MRFDDLLASLGERLGVEIEDAGGAAAMEVDGVPVILRDAGDILLLHAEVGEIPSDGRESILAAAMEANWLYEKFGEGEYRDVPGLCKVADRSEIEGKGWSLMPGAYVGVEAKVGRNCYIAPNAVVMFRCVLGDKVVLHPGVVIGGDGFGFIPGPQGLVKVPQTGIVEIGNDVEIGANTTVDRARFGKTKIKDNVKIDNQVMIAHNVEIGESSILVAQCGIAGSAQIGRGVILAAKVGINGHITIGDGVQVAGTSGVVKSVPAGSIVMGTPAEGQREFMTRLMLPKKVEKLQAKIEALTAEIEKLKAEK